MQLAGELAKINIPSLMQMVRNGELTGKICLTRGVNTTFVFVDKGRIKHVESDVCQGREALLELFLWSSGTFSYIDCSVETAPQTISAEEPADKILREGAAYAEAKKYLDQLRVGPATVLKQSGKPAGKPNLFLNALDGHKTVAEVSASCNLTRFEYMRCLHEIIADGQALVVEDASDRNEKIELPEWVVSRLKQDNTDVSRAIVEMVIWVDRLKCWMYQADADLDRLVCGLEEQCATPVTPKAPDEPTPTVADAHLLPDGTARS